MNKEMMDMLSEINTAVAEQKSASVETSANIDKRVSELSEQLAEVKKTVAKGNAVEKIGEFGETEQGVEHKAAFMEFIRHGNEAPLREMKATNTANTLTDSSGGYLVPTVIDLAVTEMARELNVLEGLFGAVTISNDEYVKNYQTSGSGTQWANQVSNIATATNTYNATPEFARIVIPAHALTSEPALSMEAMEDSATNAEALLIAEIGKEMAAAKELAFATGTGTGQPTGILTTTGASESIVSVKAIASAAAGTITGDDLLGLIYDVKPQFLNGAKFVCNRSTLEAIRKLKDLNGNYLFSYATQLDGSGVIGQLLGFPVVTCESYPNTGKMVSFGQHSGMTVVNRVGMSVLRNPYRISGAVSLFARQRVGAGLTNGSGLRVLTVA